MSRLTPAGAALAAAAVACPMPVAHAASGFPVTVTAANGKILIEQKPTRIVALSASATETLFAIGAGRQVIAVDDQSNFPLGVPRTKLSGYRPNAEAVARYRPDLVVTSSASNKLLPALRKLKIPVLLEPSATTIGGAYGQMRQIGAATGHPRAAKRLVARMKRGIAAAVASVPKARGLSVFHELSPDSYSATSKTFIGRIYALFGFRNIADRAGGAGDYPQLSGEYILAADPDVVVLADTICCKQTPAKVRARPGWRSISAVRRNRVIAVSDDVASRWGPRIVDFARIVARVVARAT
jgi:iron complex transport system substrate-binding protein